MMEKEYCTAVVLAAGQGKRMGTGIQKQYLPLAGKPILYYPLKAFQDSGLIDEIILVCGPGEEGYCRENFVERYKFSKVSHIVTGGEERYHSVWNALQAAGEKGYIFIHDGARPFVDEGIIRRGYEEVRKSGACVAAMPVKDTIKIADDDRNVQSTPRRSGLWSVQTPQIFRADLIKRAYFLLIRGSYDHVTDDAMVVETMLEHPVKLYYGSYHNIKITTPEDLEIGEIFIKYL